MRDTTFAALDVEGRLELYFPEVVAREMLASHPEAQVRPHGLRIALTDLNGQQLNYWVRRAWLARAPKTLAQQATAAESVTPGQVGDLPKAIGRPATQALVNAGITHLEQLTRRTRAEIAGLHGVGPKAVRVLKETLAESGQSFHSE
ncbi:hypothetical protein AB0H76_18390 [Nocardia sp. NPDC050712]|uniref:hypothetical protein n=1 Tax=Nocardia sp. NPDC050712 TaxID=3155518 RepID=UPI0033CFBB4D